MVKRGEGGREEMGKGGEGIVTFNVKRLSFFDCNKYKKEEY